MSPCWVLAVPIITSIDFQQQGEDSLVSISASQSLVYRQERNESNNQIVLTFPNAQLGPNAKRYLDTSSFNSPVKLIQPFRSTGNNDTKVVIQLRSQASSEVQWVASRRINVTIREGSSRLQPTPSLPEPNQSRMRRMPEPAPPPAARKEESWADDEFSDEGMGSSEASFEEEVTVPEGMELEVLPPDAPDDDEDFTSPEAADPLDADPAFEDQGFGEDGSSLKEAPPAADPAEDTGFEGNDAVDDPEFMDDQGFDDF